MDDKSFQKQEKKEDDDLRSVEESYKRRLMSLPGEVYEVREEMFNLEKAIQTIDVELDKVEADLYFRVQKSVNDEGKPLYKTVLDKENALVVMKYHNEGYQDLVKQKRELKNKHSLLGFKLESLQNKFKALKEIIRTYKAGDL